MPYEYGSTQCQREPIVVFPYTLPYPSRHPALVVHRQVKVLQEVVLGAPPADKTLYIQMSLPDVDSVPFLRNIPHNSYTGQFAHHEEYVHFRPDEPSDNVRRIWLYHLCSRVDI